jgi:sec-independent protein translocase protein TatB
MFDIGFWELLLIAVVALLVIGPERLPGVARTAGVWVGRVRRFVVSVRADVDRELKQEELAKLLEEQKKSLTEVHEIIEETRDSVEQAVGSVTREADNIASTADAGDIATAAELPDKKGKDDDQPA